MDSSARPAFPTVLSGKIESNRDNIESEVRSGAASISLLSSDSASTPFRPTYYGLIEANTAYIANFIKPYVKRIASNDGSSINGYSLGPSIGHGQFGKVYKAYLKSKNSVYAIKMIPKRPWNNQYSMNQTMRQIQIWRSRGAVAPISSDEAIMLMNVQKCRWELYAVSRLSSPYIASFKECLDSPQSKSIWIVTEWCNLGELKWCRSSCDQVLPQWEMLMPQCDVLSFTRKALIDLVLGLRYLRSQGCIHRDIKPSNILVDGDRKLLKISDFGCCVLVPESLPFKNASLMECYLAELNKIVGTPAFIAPELCHFAESNIQNVQDGFQLDVWSLGVTLYCLQHNELPFCGDNEFDTYQKAMNLSLGSQLNGELLNDLVISRLLEKDPSKRIDIKKLADLVLPKDLTSKNKDNKPVRRFFNKIWKFKTKKRDEPTPIAEETSEVLELRSRPSDVSPEPTLSMSSYEEPIQITEFLDTVWKPPRVEETHDSDHEISFSQDHREPSEKSDHFSILSISPIKLATPIKALIRIKSSPHTGRSQEPKTSPYSKSPSKTKPKNKRQKGRKLAHSHDIVNFQKYIQPQQDSNENVGAPLTPQDIEEYLRFADTK
ncbi:hypothetical protein HG536_0G00890 [Torulaspora globosa]|uniref:non-specific serine/threonine protein kinase n=1 Tax=Torulaspora globosa TaxID=48254 RepID=A0A7G3ZL46_9SACH|nr:uncharacterized protein HG536_0G00890 [Torulaspora globosa]QLL34232.1 hypothetical protein HG536_0G00890 [Torulaspora globosa]